MASVRVCSRLTHKPCHTKRSGSNVDGLHREQRQRQEMERRREYKRDVGSREWQTLMGWATATERHLSALKRLRSCLLQLFQDEDPSASLLDSACMTAMRTCVSVSLFSVALESELKLKLGVVSNMMRASSEAIFEAVRSLELEDEEHLDSILRRSDQQGTWDFFGNEINFDGRSRTLMDKEDFSLLSNPIADDFSLSSNLNFGKLTNVVSNGNQMQAEALKAAEKQRDLRWLEERVKNFYGDEQPMGMSVSEFSLTVATLLSSSSKSAEELQTELFDLMGFERFDLIQEVLQHKQDVVAAFAMNKRAVKQEIASAALAMARETVGPQQPNYGCQVLVQSEDERLLRKQMRREEKKLNRLRNRNNDYDEEDENDQQQTKINSSIVNTNVSLVKAMNQPLLTRSTGRPEQYPYVFDMQSQTKLTAGFIQGVKLSLPSTMERRDEKKYEEVHIPAISKSDVMPDLKLVKISDLNDHVGKMAFEGIKSLNRIQSIVYESAYKTNENLLVCAPTGAGKTNVAMLCIAQTIRQHIVDGVIKKDAFKIVYVAPMKALAAEMTANFAKRLSPLGITVKELTGDMQLTKSEILTTQMLVTTPEKWDVVTRKPGDVSLAQLVRLLIIDEVHLLHGDRGPVIEALVARTLRLVESSQTVIRVVGLSATLPNYIDVARFLRVNPHKGLFFFDGRFRPVPLAQTFVGIKSPHPMQQINDMNEVCYEKVVDFLRRGHQVMVFVHARNATVKSGMLIREMAQNRGHSEYFEPSLDNASAALNTSQQLKKSRNKQLSELSAFGIGFHHAGMLRSDRNLVEKAFSDGVLKVLVCTATLAWGVNLPAHGVIIKGTEIYDAKRGSFVDLGILDVLQIFGRAGRPQFDSSGHGIIITAHDKLSHYLSLLTNQFPIESNFVQFLADNLNAEIALGTVTNVEEAVKWLSYTYLFVRIRKNPLVYGIGHQDLEHDSTLMEKRTQFVIDAARKLDKARMIRFDERSGYLHATDQGRTGSHFYVKYDTMDMFNEKLRPVMNEADILAMLTEAQEFEQLKVRDEEMDEIDDLLQQNCHINVRGGAESVQGKVSILLQSHISCGRLQSFSLISDQNYVVQNASRIIRALFEIVLKKNWPIMAGRVLKFSKSIERQMWDFETPLKQHPLIKYDVLAKLETKNLRIEAMREMDSKDLGLIIRHERAGVDLKKAAFEVPTLSLEASLQPITRTVLRIKLKILPDFRWNDRVHGRASEPFWLWVEDPDSNHIYHSEYVLLTRKQVQSHELQELIFTIPIFEPLPTQYYVRVTSDRWLGSEVYLPLSFKHLILPERHPPHTDLLDLQPLSLKALNNEKFEELYNFDYFNPIQTQIFHTLYHHTEVNVLLGAPTGSGKTIAAELAMLAVFRDRPTSKVVYIAPLKALVRERIADWKRRIEEKLGKRVIELTGDVTPDSRAIASCSVIVTTPEKWDGISRSWQTRQYVKDVALIVIDEIHLLGEERGPVLEVIVSRTNFIAAHTDKSLRIVGLSTALANARDLADWLAIKDVGLFNFRPSVRPVPIEVHVSGFAGKHYCPRMATMNKPAFQAIVQHSPEKPALIFVSSRRQTRLTAQDLISCLAAEENPKMWLHMSDADLNSVLSSVKDQHVRLFLAFGIGIHHAGLVERDRKTVEELYVNQCIQVLIATATVAWGVNFPTHLVIVKGTEFYDGKLKRYVDMPITDILQMIGRAGRPQYDDTGVACVFVKDAMKHFYKKFLYEPFPVESSLLKVLSDHLLAEIVAGTIGTKQEALDYLTWTFFFRRLLLNPSYYGLEDVDESNLNSFLSNTIEHAVDALENSQCLLVDEDERTIEATTLGRIASYYYLSHKSVHHFSDNLNHDCTVEELLKVLSECPEFDELPVRHNEDQLNAELAKDCVVDVPQYALDAASTKTNLLLQAHFGRLQLPCTDYYTDTKSVLDQAIRILQAMIDISGDSGYLSTTLSLQLLLQMIVQGRWHKDPSMLILPHLDPHMLKKLTTGLNVSNLASFVHMENGKAYDGLMKVLGDELEDRQIDEVLKARDRFPKLHVKIELRRPNGASQVVNVMDENEWLSLSKDTEYTLLLTLKRGNRFVKEAHNKAYAPRFPKPKDEGWFLVLGDTEQSELLALRRVSLQSHQQQLTFFSPLEVGRVVYSLYIISDAYLGLDQQYELRLDINDDENDVDMEDMADEERFKLLEEAINRKKKNEDKKLKTISNDSHSNFEAMGARPKQRKRN